MNTFDRLVVNDDLEAGLPPLEPEPQGFGTDVDEPTLSPSNTLAQAAVDLAGLDPGIGAAQLAAVLGDKESANAFQAAIKQAARLSASTLHLAAQQALQKRIASGRMDSGDLIKLMTQTGKDSGITPTETAPPGTGFSLNVHLGAPPAAVQVVEQVDPLGLAGLPIRGASQPAG